MANHLHINTFKIKDSGERTEFASGMVRDACPDKVDYTSIFFGPMLKRWASHLTKGRKKYPDPQPGVPNWTLADGVDELNHAKRSLLRHVVAYMEGLQDEDHAAAIYFNVNLIEYIQDKLNLRDSIVWPEGGLPRCGQLTRRPHYLDGDSRLRPCRFDEGHDGPHES